MAIPYAEVIGDPVAHSKSPVIHGFWLEKLGIDGEYRKLQVTPHDLPRYLETKRNDLWWRGCNVTAPLKQHAAGLVGAPAAVCGFVGSVNCVTRTPLSCLVGTNTDISGIAEALADVPLRNRHVLLIGAGGAARAALCHLLREDVGKVTIAVRDPAKAEPLRRLGGDAVVEVTSFDAAGRLSPYLVINATPLGMQGVAPMPGQLSQAAAKAEVVFDMVYAPVETPLLVRAREAKAKAIDGLAMLVGQAAPAFELFFGAAPPRAHDSELRRLLVA